MTNPQTTPRAAFIHTLRARIAAYEAHYGVPSQDIHHAIDQHTPPETEAVCDWLMDYALLTLLCASPTVREEDGPRSPHRTP